VADRKILAPLVEQRKVASPYSPYPNTRGVFASAIAQRPGHHRFRSFGFRAGCPKLWTGSRQKKTLGLNPGSSLKHWDQECLYSTFLAVLAVACSTGLEALRAIATYMSPSFDTSDMWVSYAFLAY